MEYLCMLNDNDVENIHCDTLNLFRFRCHKHNCTVAKMSVSESAQAAMNILQGYNKL